MISSLLFNKEVQLSLKQERSQALDLEEMPLQIT